MKRAKFIYLSVVQANYGYGWEDLTQSENYREAAKDLRAYRVNEGLGEYRLISRRERNEY